MRRKYSDWVAASLVTLLSCALIFQFSYRNRAPSLEPGVLGDLAEKVNSNLESIAVLHSEVRSMREVLTKTKGAESPQSKTKMQNEEYLELHGRLESLENALEYASILSRTFPLQHQDTFASVVDKRRLDAEVSEAQVYANNESHFEEDSGKPLGNYTDSIGEAIQAVDGVDLEVVDCGDTICRITYSKSASLGSQEKMDIDSELADKLMFGAEGRAVELRYGRDTTGNDLIYIQVK